MVSKSNTQTLGIIIPMFNEEKGAALCVDAVMKHIAKLPQVKKLIISNDGSTDNTLLILKEKQKKYTKKLSIVTSKINYGYGNALKKGIEEARGLHLTYVLFMDSDLTNDPSSIADFVKQIPNEYDCIKASRFIPGGGMRGIPLKRVIFSYCGSFIVRNFFRIGIKDCTNGFRMIKLDKLKDINLKENNFAIILEELYYLKKMKATFFEIPTILSNRQRGKTHFSYTPSLLFTYVKYACKALLIP